MIRCEFEHGSKANLRHVTADTILVREGKIFMGRRLPEYVEGGKWCLPGGYMNRDEKIFETAARETLEESGWECANQVLMGVYSDPQTPGDDRQNVKFAFIAEATKKVRQPDHETTETMWFDLDDLPPRAEIAFDHADLIETYLQHQKHPLQLPIII